MSAAILGLLGALLAGCGGSSMFSSDLLSRDVEWFQRPGRLFIRNVSVDSPPLTPDKPVTPADFISAEGACPGMEAANANALGAEGGAAPAPGGTVALGHTECDVARAVGTPDSVALSANERGARVATLTYLRGPRAGIYTFTDGRLSVVERGAEAASEPKPAKGKPKRRVAG